MALPIQDKMQFLDVNFEPQVNPAIASTLVIPEIVEQIFSFCDNNSINSSSLVCKGFHAFLNNNYSLHLGIFRCEITKFNRLSFDQQSKIFSFRILLRAFTENKLSPAQSEEFTLLLQSVHPKRYSVNYFTRMITLCECKIPDISGYIQLVFANGSECLQAALCIHIIDNLPSDINEEIKEFIAINEKKSYVRLIAANKYPQLIIDEVKNNKNLGLCSIAHQHEDYAILGCLETAVGSTGKMEDYNIYERIIGGIQNREYNIHLRNDYELTPKRSLEALIANAISLRNSILGKDERTNIVKLQKA